MFLCLSLSAVLVAQTPTFSEDIAPILYENCTSCHRAGEVAPFSLESYEDAVAFAPTIKYATGIRYMPPWKPNPDYSRFMDERFLNENQIQMIADWVDGGMPLGDTSMQPAPPTFPEGSSIGTPDLVLSMAEAYQHKGNMVDEYRVFVIPTNLTEDKQIAAIELRPGNRKIVHHALFSYDLTGEGKALDNETAEYGYQSFGGFGVDAAFDKQFPPYVPGVTPPYYRAGMGQLLPAGADFLIQMHYAPVPTDEVDSSSINIFFKKEPVSRQVQQHVMLPFDGTLTNGPFFIPANEVKTFHGVYRVPSPMSILGVGPHMHLLGKDWTVFVKHANGDTTHLIQILDWDFNWQSGYFYKQPMIAQPGDEIHAYATYDNTSDNPLNPNDPPVPVSWGDFTTDEMFYLPFFHVPYQSGDESLNFEDLATSSDPTFTKPSTRLYPIYPNPEGDEVTVGFQLVKAEKISIKIVNAEGRLVQKLVDNQSYFPGQHKITAVINDLASGYYFVQLEGKDFSLSEKILVK